MNRCNDCLFALEHRPGVYHCHNPVVNRDRPAFLAGNARSAASCFSERQNPVGLCGKPGKLYEPRAKHV
ncbi:MAG: hypothetical protein KA200_00055 [Burkholderiales bacterium]|nr:hypothetical protein [Burkholderiales bacterium]